MITTRKLGKGVEAIKVANTQFDWVEFMAVNGVVYGGEKQFLSREQKIASILKAFKKMGKK